MNLIGFVAIFLFVRRKLYSQRLRDKSFGIRWSPLAFESKRDFSRTARIRWGLFFRARMLYLMWQTGSMLFLTPKALLFGGCCHIHWREWRRGRVCKIQLKDNFLTRLYPKEESLRMKSACHASEFDEKRLKKFWLIKPQKIVSAAILVLYFLLLQNLKFFWL